MHTVICPYCPQRSETLAEAQEHVATMHEPILRSIELPPLQIGSISERARETAETLLEAFYLQDEREANLIRENAHEAKSLATRAQDRMAEAYRLEFPHIDSDRAELAGREFIRALFLHDEIENWEFLDQLLPNDELSQVMITDTSSAYTEKAANDPRWDTVEDKLMGVCQAVNINQDYASKQAQFWRLHGQIHEYWEQVAHAAHTIKLEAMLPRGKRADIDALAQYFVAGVKLHDDWGHQYKDRDLNDIKSLVAKYYQKVFDIREVGRPGAEAISERND